MTGMNTRRRVWREPVGVVGAIVPWNFPFEETIHKLAFYDALTGQPNRTLLMDRLKQAMNAR